MGSKNYDGSQIGPDDKITRRSDANRSIVSNIVKDDVTKNINDEIFDVASVSGLVSWWDITDSSTVILDQVHKTVAVWQDKGAATGDLYNTGSAANGPVIVENGLNGKKSMLIRSTRLENKNYTPYTNFPFSLFAVSQVKEFDYLTPRLFEMTSSSSGSYEVNLTFVSGDNTRLVSTSRQGGGESSVVTRILSANKDERDRDVVKPYITNYIFDSTGGVSIYLNGKLRARDTTTSTPNLTNRVWIGGAENSGRELQGYINEVMILNTDERDSQLQKSINEYLSTKWDIPLED